MKSARATITSSLFLWVLFCFDFGLCECVVRITEAPTDSSIEGDQLVGRLLLCLPAEFGEKFTSFDGEVAVEVSSPDVEGCEPLDNQSEDDWAALIDRGTCSFVEKAENAEKAGATVMIVASNDGTITTMGYNETEEPDLSILSVMINNKDSILIQENLPMKVTVEEYLRPAFDISVVVLMVSASLLVVAGAFWSATEERQKYLSLGAVPGPAPQRRESRIEVAVINQKMAFGFIIVASLALLLLFYFISFLIWVIIGVFCLGGTIGLVGILAPLMKWVFPSLKRKNCTLPVINEDVGLVEVVLFPICTALSVWWVIARQESYAWLLQNILCIGLILMFQKSIRIPNLKIAAILLTTMFVYDIFWVFISPFIFEGSVMIEVATGGDSGETVPLLIIFPRVSDELSYYGQSYSMLGLGDIALPGLFISFLLRFDYEMGYSTWKRGYFWLSVIGYVVGLLITDIVLVTTRMGQPALLYLVPLTLIPVAWVAHKRGELSPMWTGLHSDEYTNANQPLQQPELTSTVANEDTDTSLPEIATTPQHGKSVMV